MSSNPKAIVRNIIEMSHYIPFEIQVEIMKRLPVKSLIRFESVCKAWKSFIHSSEFIADYCNSCHPQQCLFVFCRDYNYNKKYVSIVDDDTFPLHKLSHTIPSSVNLFNQVAMLGSSQGLLCFYGYMDGDLMAVIWNPSIRKSVDIVVSSKIDWSKYNFVVGFGVCPRTFDPRLVKIIYVKTANTIAEYTPTQVEVFTISSGVWKNLSINMPRKSIHFTHKYRIDLDGFIYWLAYDQVDARDNHNMIMSFDMTSEKFIEISLPDSLACIYNHYDLSISKRMESLVVLECNSMSGKRVFNVWLMESGAKNSFTKLFTIEAPEASIGSVLGFRKSGEPIIEMDKNWPDPNNVYLYEQNSRHISNIGVCADLNFQLASSYTDTLLLLDQ